VLEGLLVGVGLVTLPVAQTQAPTTTASTAKAAAPEPSATAKNQSQKTSIGKGGTSVKASSPASYWTDMVDIDVDGTVEDNQFLCDAQSGIL
jgi:hypothetical protein